MEEDKIFKEIIDVVGDVAPYVMAVSTPFWSVRFLITFYMFWKKYYPKSGFLGLKEKDIQNDLISADIKRKKIERELREARERLGKISGDENYSQSSQRMTETEIMRFEREYEQILGRIEFDKYVLEFMRCRKVLAEKGAWKELEKASQKMDREIKKKMKKSEKTIKNKMKKLNFRDYANHMYYVVHEVCEENTH